MKTYFSKLKTDEESRRRFRQLLPAMIADQAALTLLGVINTLLLSHTDTVSMSGVAQAESFCTVLSAALYSVCIGSSVLTAQNMGRGDKDSVSDTSSQTTIWGALLTGLLCLVLFFVRVPILRALFRKSAEDVLAASFDYAAAAIPSLVFTFIISQVSGLFRAADDAKTPLFISVLVNVVNLVLGLFLITGIGGIGGFGATGAGLTLLFSKMAGALVSIFFLCRTHLPVRLKRIRLTEWTQFFAALPVGLSASVDNLLFYGARLVLQMMIAGLGALVISANQIVLSIHNFAIIIPNAIALSAYPIVGNNYGRKDYDRCRNNDRYIGKLTLIACSITAVVFLIFPKTIIGFYTQDPALTGVASAALIAEAVSLFFWSHGIYASVPLRSTGVVVFPLLVNSLSVWIMQDAFVYFIGIPLGLGATGIWIGFGLSTLARAVVIAVYKRRTGWPSK